MAHGAALLFDLVARDGASPAFLRVAGAADKTAAATMRSQKSLAGFSAVASRNGARLTKSLTLPLLAVGAVSVSQASKYQKSLNTIQVATDRTNAQMAQGSKGLLTISKATGTGLEQLTDSFYVASKAGFDVSKSLAVSKAAAQGAKAENADLGTVTNALTSIMASYGKQISSPVEAMNMIVKSAGLAKVSTQDFASSLSTVVPLASAAHMSFAQIGGAIATLTQHGTSAQEATQELAFTIRNLQAPNNVAISAMNQLGFSAVDISKSLGKRGLTGTFDMIMNTLPKSATVYVGAMKRMEAGSSDLTLMQSKMPPALKLASKEFLNGTISMREYRRSYRDMGAAGNAQGRQFLTLSQKVKGYSDAVKSGTPAQKTVVSLLKQMFGGANGLNTVLQLTGESARYFAKTTEEVAHAGKHAGGDVLGWAKTQNTFAVKLDKAKASLQVMAVEIGTALIPAVSKVVDWVSKGVHWFDELSGTDKKLAVWGLGVVAAIGPVMRVVGGLGRMGAGLATFAGASSTAASRVSTSMQRIGTAVGGLALAYGGTQTKGAGGAIMGALGGGLTGAAIGSFFGPIGTAVGGISGALVGLGAHFLMAGDDGEDAGRRAAAAAEQARQRIEQQKQAVNDLTTAILSDSDALGANTRAQVVNDLQKTKVGSKGPSALQLAQQAGINPNTVVSATMGNKKAQASLQGQADVIGRQLATKGLTAETSKQSQALGKLLTLMDQEGVLLSRGGQQADLQAMAMGKLNLSTRDVATQVRFYGETLDQSTTAGKMNNKFIEDHVTALNKEHNAGKLTQAQWLSQLGMLDKQATKYGLVKDEVAKYIGAYAHIPKSVATKLLADPKTAKSAIGDVLRSLLHIPSKKTTALSANPALAHATIAQLQTQIDSIRQGRVPGVAADTALGRSAIADLQARIDALTGKTVIVTTQFNTRGTPLSAVDQSMGAGKKPKGKPKARGGLIQGPGTGTSDTAGVYALSNGEAVIPAKAVSRHRDVVDALISAGRGLASGGIVHRGKDWIVNGTKYASKRAAENAQKRAKKTDQSGLSSRVSSAISGIGQSYSAPFTLADVGSDRVASTIGAASAALSRAAAAGLSKKAQAGLRGQIGRMVKIANAQLSALRLKVRDSDINGLKSALKSSVDDTRTALDQLYTDMARSGVAKTVQNAVRSGGAQLVTLRQQLDAANDRLSTMKDFASGISDTLTGAFDPTKSGSVTDLLAGLSGATDNNNRYSSQLSGLLNRSKGDATLTGFINQLALSGNTATLETLAGSSAAEFTQVSKAVGAYNTSVSSGVDAATTGKYGATVAQQQALNDAQVARLDRIATAMGTVVVRLGRPQINIGGKVLNDTIDKRVDSAIRDLEHELAKGR